MWIFAQSPFKSVLLGRHTSSPIPESLCLEFVAPPSHSAHRPQGGLRQSAAFFGTQTPPVGQPPAWVLFQQLCAPQTTLVHVRVPLTHVHVLQSSCMSVLCHWRMSPPGRRQCLQSRSSSGSKERHCLRFNFCCSLCAKLHDKLFKVGYSTLSHMHGVTIIWADSLRRRANAGNVSFRISLRWPIHIIDAALQFPQIILPWQRAPNFPGGQMHSKPFILSLHVAPSLHGDELHSLMLTLQTGPVNPGEQLQECQPSPSTHVAPLWQGFEAQSSTPETQRKYLVFGSKSWSNLKI